MGLSDEIRGNVEKIAKAAREPETIDNRLFEVQLKILAKAILELDRSFEEIATRLRTT